MDQVVGLETSGSITDELRDFVIQYQKALKKESNSAFWYRQLCHNLQSSDKEFLVSFLLDFLLDELYHYNYQEEYFYLEAIFPLVASIMDNSQIPKEKILLQIEECHKVAISFIRKKPKAIKESHPNYIMLKSVLCELDGLHLAMESNFEKIYQGNYYELVSYLFFQKKI